MLSHHSCSGRTIVNVLIAVPLQTRQGDWERNLPWPKPFSLFVHFCHPLPEPPHNDDPSQVRLIETNGTEIYRWSTIKHGSARHAPNWWWPRTTPLAEGRGRHLYHSATRARRVWGTGGQNWDGIEPKLSDPGTRATGTFRFLFLVRDRSFSSTVAPFPIPDTAKGAAASYACLSLVKSQVEEEEIMRQCVLIGSHYTGFQI